MRWHEPQASTAPCPFCTIAGAGLCSSGNQSGGLNRSSISFGVYFFVLPGTDFGSGDSAGSVPAWIGNAHAGSRAGGDGSAVGVPGAGCGACCDVTVAEATAASAMTSVNTRVVLM